jgi:D-cysteine desulfhydrase
MDRFWRILDVFVKFHDTKGIGYAVSTAQELQFIKMFSTLSGIVLDPVYTGKAFKGYIEFLKTIQPPQTCTPFHQNVLFWHTGGFLGLFGSLDKLKELNNH